MNVKTQRVDEAMQPTQASVRLSDTTATALERMEEGQLPFLPVLGGGSDEVIGVILWRAAEFGCRAMGHGPTAVSSKTISRRRRGPAARRSP